MCIRITRSPLPTKRFRAYFKDGKHTDFGQKRGQTYIDHHNKVYRAAYIARHSKNDENWQNPKSAGALSRFLLWGPHPTLEANLVAFRQRFGL